MTNDELVAGVREDTEQIREHQRAIEGIGQSRKQKIMSLRSRLVTYREIAQAMQTSEQNVYKIIRDEIPNNPRLDEHGNPLPRRGRPRKSSHEQ